MSMSSLLFSSGGERGVWEGRSNGGGRGKDPQARERVDVGLTSSLILGSCSVPWFGFRSGSSEVFGAGTRRSARGVARRVLNKV